MLKHYYGKKNITTEQQELVKKVFLETGALTYSQKKVKKLIAQAKTIIPDITNDRKDQLLLNQFTTMLIDRKK